MSAAAVADARNFPPELTRGVAQEAARDAERVDAFLTALGLTATPERPLLLPPDFLLALGAGLRLLSWEAQGLTVHRNAGLPTARDVIRDAFRAVTDPGRLPRGLPVAVLRVWVENFHWGAREELDADILIGALDSDDGVEALAEFLWAARGRTPTDRSVDTCEG